MSDVPRFTDPESAERAFERLVTEAQARGVSLRPPPERPTTCCGKGCHGCVWEGYYAAASYWCEQALARLR